jgi:butyryl-CoA dehydrogenase
MRAGIKKWQDVASHLQSFAGKGQIEQYLSDANLFLEMSSLIVIGWQWIKIGVSICLSPSEARQFSESYYEGKLTSLRFFYKYEFPRINSLETTLMDKDTLTLPEGKEFLFD